MPSLKDDFEACSSRVSSGAIGGISRENQLKLYAYYSVATKGEPPARSPIPLLDPRGSAKWSAWNAERFTTRYGRCAALALHFLFDVSVAVS
jgi:acyl-CoA-binding protein